MIKKYHKTKPVQAERFDGSIEMARKYKLLIASTIVDDKVVEPSFVSIETRVGWLEMHVGDWITTSANGDHWPVANDIFKNAYEPLPVIPNTVANKIKSAKEFGTPLDILLDEATYDVDSNIDYADTVNLWIANHIEKFSQAWLDGYQLRRQKNEQ